MKKFFRSFYGKISTVFLVMLIILGFVQALITVQSCMDFMDEAKQKLNLPLAENIAQGFRPFLNDSIDIAGIEQTIKGMMVINPEIEIYLLDDTGKILAFFAENGKKMMRENVGLEPVNKFLQAGLATGNTNRLILGEDPCHLGSKKIFSAAPIGIGKYMNGYVYVMLGGEVHDSAISVAMDNYIVRGTLKMLLIIFLFSAAIGLILFFLLTKRFQVMTNAVKKFEEGDLNKRIGMSSNDEIGELANAFDQMADRIVENIEDMKTKDRLRRNLIANISHDLRSPLASIQGYLETILLKNATLTEEDRRKLLETIFKNTTQLSNLVSELFELSKLDAKQTLPKPEPFSLAELAQDVMLKFKQQADKQLIKLNRSFPEKLPLALGDIGLIERALSNLLENAITFTPAKGKITVKLIQDKNRIKIQISDTGYGIPSEDLPFVFDRFYRVEKSRTRSANGSAGLGLAITKKIVEAHNSVITVQSDVNKGTSFLFELPVYG